MSGPTSSSVAHYLSHLLALSPAFPLVPAQVVLLIINCCRAYMFMAFGTGLKPLSTIPSLVYNIRLDAAVEIFVVSVLEQVCCSPSCLSA